MTTRFSKSVLALLAASLLIAGPALAGNGNGDGTGNGGGKAAGNGGGVDTEWNGGPANKMARLSEMLGLSDEQEDAILNHFRDQEARREEMRAQIWAMFGPEICAQREANQGSFEALLATILDAEQLMLHEEMKANREAKRANRQNKRGNGNFECPAPIDAEG